MNTSDVKHPKPATAGPIGKVRPKDDSKAAKSTSAAKKPEEAASSRCEPGPGFAVDGTHKSAILPTPNSDQQKKSVPGGAPPKSAEKKS